MISPGKQFPYIRESSIKDIVKRLVELDGEGGANDKVEPAQAGHTDAPPKSPTYMSFNRSRASSEWPTSSKASVASLPARYSDRTTSCDGFPIQVTAREKILVNRPREQKYYCYIPASARMTSSPPGCCERSPQSQLSGNIPVVVLAPAHHLRNGATS